MIGNALSFDGSTNSIELSNTGSPLPTGPPFTLYGSFAPDSGASGTICALTTGINNGHFYRLLAVQSTGTVALQSRAGAAPTVVNRTHSVTLTAGVWHRACATLDASDNWAVNVDASETTGNDAFIAPNSTDSYAVGAVTGTAAGIAADISIWACWDVELDASERDALGNGFHPLLVRPASLVAWGYPIGTAPIDAGHGRSWTETGTLASASNGGKIYLPTPQYVPHFVPAAVAGGATAGTLGLLGVGI